MHLKSVIVAAVVLLAGFAVRAEDLGVLPVGDDGKPLNLDFETGTLKDWKAEGAAFDGQPIKGDAVNARQSPEDIARHSDEHANQQGNYWIGTYELDKDGPRGKLTSVPFKVTHPWASFLVGGGESDQSVEVILADGNTSFFRASGKGSDEMHRVAVDLTKIQGKQIYIRVTDDNSFAGGHINFDDFRFHTEEPKIEKTAALTRDAEVNAGLAPEDAARAITMPPGFKATLFAGEPDVNQPVGFCMDDRGRLWVAEAWTYPVRAPEGKGKDRILIFEDTDGDGKMDKRTVFAEGLNLVSGIEVGFGGVWVGASPYLLFIPDRDHDDKPDGPPEVLLDGWAYNDTHETLNAFTWGPDGWLYGCHGVFTHSLVGKAGTPDKERVPLNAAVWRYHPTRHVFEVFAEGGSNQWGVDFNDRGQAFITACVIPHLYHMIEGGRYFRQAGEHFNPNVYKDIETIADHVHWLGDNGPHAGNEKSSSAGGGHAHCGAMIYLGNSWPAEYKDTILMGNIHGNRVNEDRLEPKGSGYIGTHAPDPVMMNDKWSRLINLKYGPDGSVYLIDWYDKRACHSAEPEVWDRTNGRIYKLTYNNQPAVTVDLAKKSNAELAQEMLNPNDWYVRHARRLLQERNAGAEISGALTSLLSNEDPTRRLRGLWALHCTDALTPEIATKAMHDADPYVRAWTIQLVAEGFGPMDMTRPFAHKPELSAQSAQWLSTLAEMAKSDPSPIVRLYVASALQRVPAEQRWPALTALVAHAEDKDDRNLPYLYWYAAEASVAADVDRGIELAKGTSIPMLQQFIARRICTLATNNARGNPDRVDVKPLTALAGVLSSTSDEALQLNLLIGMQDSLRGWPSLPTPGGWAAVYEKLIGSKNDLVRTEISQLSVVFGEDRAMTALRKTVSDTNESALERRNAIEALTGAKDKALAPVLQTLVADAAVRSAAVKALAAYDDPNTPAAVVKVYSSLPTEVKLEALNTLASRPDYARAMKAAIDAGTISKTDLTAATLRQLATLDDEEIKQWLATNYGTVRKTSAEKQREIQSLNERLSRRIDRADPSRGRAIFAKTCMQCHTLFGTGGNVGPDLTGSNRADLNYILSNVVDPSAVIAKEYMVSIIHLKKGRVVSGIVKSDDGNSMTVRTEAELLTIAKADVERQSQQNISMMPEGLLAPMEFNDILDLVGYLRGSKQVPMLVMKTNVNSFFNGKDLTNWTGDPALWSVENGELVGRTAGLKNNAFIFSDMLVEDFRLKLKVKLVGDKGNSGVQFRSESLPDGEAKGYQADVGPGWWGKLYEENGRAIMVNEGGEQWVKKDDWNDYEIIAVEEHIRTSINGHICVDIDDRTGAAQGRIGLQLHAGGPTEVLFKDIVIEANPKMPPKPAP